ncbi:hypothetical protein GCM10028796_46840 [Ramlibacter monticola]|uniref:Uncharacterized protein n=1 Tax=Ramlibacter monticola TaxID=1926872 RepID=A0A937CWA3_9BURK|nr:hypothetical protein [Ramlibacter monticola]MBL0394309.1 hypothetical protein [Ramlibacter monticola]
MDPLDAGMDDYRVQLALLHSLAHRRADLLRRRMRDPDAISELNAAISEQRAVVRAARSQLAQLMAGQPGSA